MNEKTKLPKNYDFHLFQGRVGVRSKRSLRDHDGGGSHPQVVTVIMEPNILLVLFNLPIVRPRVPTVRDSCNPVWEENNVFDFPIEVVQGQELLLELYDDDDR